MCHERARFFALGVAFVALATLPYWMPGIYYINVASQILFYAIFALGLNMLVGYAGLVSLGHAGLFGVTAYATGYMLAARLWPSDCDPRRAAWSAWSRWRSIAALSLRATGIGFIMITLALGQILWGLAYRWISLTGGDNGLSVQTRPAPFGYVAGDAERLLLRDAGRLPVAVAAVAIFVRSPFGAALRGTRDQPRRMNALGYHVWAIRFCACLFSGLLTAVAGDPVRLLHPVHQPADAGAHRLRRSAADGDLWRRRHAARTDRRGGAGGRRQERGERLHRALEFPAWRDLRRHRHPDAGRPGARHRAAVAAGVAEARARRRNRLRQRGGEAMSALTVSSLCKSFGGLRVTTDVNLNVEPGERRLIIGPNGAGKTTLFNLITGELTPDCGSIQLFGQDITAVPSRRRAHLGMARTYQIITLFARDTILRNVTLALLGLSPSRWNPMMRPRPAARPGRPCSRGAGAGRPRTHRRTGRCRRPPMASAGVSKSPWRWRKIRRSCCSTSRSPACRSTSGATCSSCCCAIPRDVTIVMIEHNMDVALEFAERITLLHFGEVIVEGNRAEVVADPRTREVYLGH